MKIFLWLGLLMSLLLPTTVAAQSPFDGTWKLDPDTAQTEAKPEVYLQGRHVQLLYLQSSTSFEG
jgi:hypothetical protein